MQKLLYRYIAWDDLGAKRFFTDNELYFYSAQNWEKDGEYHFELLDFTEQAVFEIVSDIAIDMHNYNFKEYELWMNIHAEKYGIDLGKLSSVELDLADQYFSRQIAKERIADPDKFIEVQRQLYFDQTGIFSLSKSKRSYNLWSSKRNTSSGNVICIGIDQDILMSVLTKVPNCILNEVQYSDASKKYRLIFDKTGYKSLLQLLDISYTLKSQFCDEKEVRIQRLLLNKTDNSNERTIVLPDEIFKEVIILKEADEETKSEVISLSKQKGVSKIQYSEINYDDNAVSILND